jgi:hypothetical protein
MSKENQFNTAYQKLARYSSSDTTILASVRVVMELMIFVIEALSLRVIGGKSKTSSTPPSQDPHKKGKVKQTKACNLLLRLEEYQKETLVFIEHTEVPFTNNLAERDIRMAKLQQKVSGLFKTLEGARIFCRIRSYLSTYRKSGINPITALTALFTGRLQEILLQIFKLESQIPPPRES